MQKSFHPLQIFAMGGGAVLGARMAVRRSAKSESTLTLEPTRPSHNSRKLTQGTLQGDVFLLQTPLILPSPLPSWIAQVLPKHSVVLAGVDGGYAAFDFVPAKPEDPGSALQLLLGGSVEGLCGTRKLSGLPRGAVRLGRVAEGVTVEDVINVNERFDKMLSLTANDCNSYSQSVLGAILADPGQAGARAIVFNPGLGRDAAEQRSEVQGALGHKRNCPSGWYHGRRWHFGPACRHSACWIRAINGSSDFRLDVHGHHRSFHC